MEYEHGFKLLTGRDLMGAGHLGDMDKSLVARLFVKEG